MCLVSDGEVDSGRDTTHYFFSIPKGPPSPTIFTSREIGVDNSDSALFETLRLDVGLLF